jgi:hypothetical protein
MTHHLPEPGEPGADLAWTAAFRNVLLVRDPAEVVASYVRSRESCEPADIGLLQQVRLLDTLLDTGHGAGAEPPPVIDAGDFLRDPEAHLRWLCVWAGVPFTLRMLRWPAGARASDGVWAPHWYAAVQRSTGFEAPRAREVSLTEHDAAVAEACRPAYDRLRALRVRLP